MTIADKLTLLANTKEQQRVAFSIDKSVPWGDYMGKMVTNELGQSTTTAVSQKLFTDKVVGIESRVSNTINAFATKALMEASALADGDYAMVTDDSVAENNGLYIKTAGVWAKSAYDLLSQGAINDFISVSENLFDFSKVTPNSVIKTNGNIEPPTVEGAYSVSDFIPVSASSEYTISGGSRSLGLGTGNAFIQTAYYDSNKNFITRRDTQNIGGEPRVITTLGNAAYVRFNINVGEPSSYNRMFNKGAVALPYEVGGGSTLHSVKLSQAIIEQIIEEINLNPNIEITPDIKNEIIARIKEEINLNPDIGTNPSIRNTKVFRFDQSIDAIFSTSQVWTEYTGFRDTQSAEVYAMFDALMAQHPSVITKHELGNDKNGNLIAYYKFTPKKPAMPRAPQYPTIFLDCGMHGMEHMSTLVTYLMLEQAYNNWQSDPLLEVLRHNVNFIVIPVVNPTGWNRYNRVNGNGVDINRNFPVNWRLTGTGATYSGSAPASELETQYVMRVFNENPNIDIYNNFHNFNGTSNETRYFYISGVNENAPIINGMGQKLSGVISRKWQREYDWIPDPWVSGNAVNAEVDAGKAKSYGYSRGVYLSTTFEIGGQWWIKEDAVKFDALHCKTGVELFVNWMLINLQELKRA